MSTVIEHRQEQIATARAKHTQMVRRQNRVIQAQQITPIVIDIDDEWAPRGNYDLVDLWHRGRRLHPVAENGQEIERYNMGGYHYDQHFEYKTGRIGAVFAALFGREGVRMMPEYDLMILLICRRLGCTRQELEALYEH